MKTKTDNKKKFSARNLLDFIDASPTAFHAVAEMKRKFRSAGYKELKEIEEWSLAPGGKYMTSRNGGSFLAFQVGNESPEYFGFKVIGAHTDSPHLKLKPNPVYQKAGYIQLGVETYGSVLLTTWTDRDLTLAGRVILRDSRAEPSLVDLKHPLFRIPQLAIHLNSKVNDKGLVLDKQKHMPPILGLLKSKIDNDGVLKELIAKEIGVSTKSILQFDLSLYDTQKGEIGGGNLEFLFSSRLDNLASCHAAAEGLLNVSGLQGASRIVVFFDHEEVGSGSAQGAGSTFLKDVMERIQSHFNPSREAFLRAMARSFLISSDMAHAVHPNYTEMHDAQHWPIINGGPVIKTNSNQRYASNAETSAQFERLCERVKVPVQKFVNRSDLACGSTIGPITATNLGISVVDVGSAMLAMHSIREMAGAHDHQNLILVFQEFLQKND